MACGRGLCGEAGTRQSVAHNLPLRVSLTWKAWRAVSLSRHQLVTSVNNVAHGVFSKLNSARGLDVK